MTTSTGRAARAGGPALHLHSREVTVPISKNKPPVKVTAPVPEHMREKLSGVRVVGLLRRHARTKMSASVSVKLRLDPLRRLAVVGLAAQPALTQLGDDGAGRWQALAVDLGAFVP